MGFKNTEESVPLPQLVQLSVNFIQSNDTDSIDVVATLHIRPDEIEIGEEYTVTICFKKAYLILEPDNMKSDPNSYHGMKEIPDRITKTVNLRSNASRRLEKGGSRGFTGEASSSETGLFAKFGVTRSSSSTRSAEMSVEKTEDQTIEFLPVEFYNDNRWRILPHDGDYLEGAYLREKRLCVLIRGDRKANKVGATLHFVVKPKDIEVLVDERPIGDKKSLFGNSPNRKAVLDALVAKKLKGACPQKTDASITFASIEANDEG